MEERLCHAGLRTASSLKHTERALQQLLCQTLHFCLPLFDESSNNQSVIAIEKI